MLLYRSSFPLITAFIPSDYDADLVGLARPLAPTELFPEKRDSSSPVLILALQLLSAVVQIPAQHVLEAAILQLGHDLADLPALAQPAVDLGSNLGRQLAGAGVLAGVGGRVVVGGGARGDVVVDDPHVAVAEGFDALKLEGAVAFLGGALGQACGLAGLAVAGLTGAKADPADLALALAHVAGAAHAHRVAARDGELVELELHGGAAGDGVALGRDLHGHDVGQGVDDGRVGGRGRELLLLWHGLGRAYGGGVVGAGEGHDGVVINAILVRVRVLILRRRRRWWIGLEVLLLLLLLGVLVLVLVLLLLLLGDVDVDMLIAQGALAGWRGNAQTALCAQDGLNGAQTLLEVVEAVVDDLVDALVDDGGEGVGEGA